jgi:hypothetical protein
LGCVKTLQKVPANNLIVNSAKLALGALKDLFRALRRSSVIQLVPAPYLIDKASGSTSKIISAFQQGDRFPKLFAAFFLAVLGEEEYSVASDGLGPGVIVGTNVNRARVVPLGLDPRPERALMPLYCTPRP